MLGSAVESWGQGVWSGMPVKLLGGMLQPGVEYCGLGWSAGVWNEMLWSGVECRGERLNEFTVNQK